MKFPPLNTLRAFEAAGRHQSFLLAAQELHVSAASVSRFIKLLEDDLKQTLFTRHANGVALTEVGERYLLAIQPSLHHIAGVSESFRQENQKRRLNIISIPAIAETWLVSRLWSFQQQHSDIQINLVVDDQHIANEQLLRLRPNDAVVVLNYSHGDMDGTDSFALPKDKLTLVCNHELVSTLKSPDDIFKHPLLVDIDWQGDWQAWLSRAGLWQALNERLPKNHQKFERYSMVVNAALAGSGVAIGHTTLLENYLNVGSLVAPFDITTTTDKQFYATIAKNTQRDSVKQFIDWFVGNERVMG